MCSCVCVCVCVCARMDRIYKSIRLLIKTHITVCVWCQWMISVCVYAQVYLYASTCVHV